MKTVKSYILGLAAASMLSVGFAACQDDFDTPQMEAPVATLAPNTTIAELKAAFWQDATNYADTVRTRPDGSHYIIRGRVISSDEQSNVFKFLSIQDETGAITFSINSYNLYLKYRRGQEIVVDATGMYIGKYAGLQQFGTPSYYENGSTWQVGFMSPEFFTSHIELNGLPEVAKLDTITVNSFTDFDTSPEGLRRWQGQMVRINNVHFLEGGVKTFSAYHSNDNADVNKTIVDAEGNSNVVVRTSGYATFWNKMLPAGNGDIVGILSFYQNLAGASNWQLILNDYEGCMNFGNPTIAAGTETNPYSVAEVIRLEQDATVAEGWVSGYIVGAVAPGVTEVSSDEDVQWTSEALMPYTLVIGADKDTRSISQALVIELPANTPLRQYGNLRDNPSNFGKAITVRGSFDKVMGTFGVAGNSGAASQFKIEGITTGNEGVANGDGSQTSPYSPSQIVAMNPSSTTVAVESGVWVRGYIVGYMPTEPTTALSGTVFNADNVTVATNLVIAPTPDETNYAKCVGIQLPANSVAPGLRDALNLQAHPENLGKLLSIKGDVMKYCGGPGVKNGTEYTLDGQGTPTTPTQPTDAIFTSLSENDSALPTGWSFENVNLGSLESVWSWKVYNDKGYLNASAYVSGSNVATESYAVSPVIDLGSAEKPSFTFDHAAKFQTTLRQLCGVCARVEGTTEWTELTLPVWPEAGAWTFVNSGNVSLAAFAGKRVQIAFKYGSSAAGADTWEVKNLKVLPDGGSDAPVTPDPTPAGDAVTIAASALNAAGSATVDGYTITIEKASGSTAPSFHAASGAMRLYADNTIAISGARMTKITFNINSTNSFRYTTVTPSTGSISPAQATGDTSFTWIGDATEVTFTIGHDATLGSDGASKRGQIHLDSLDIYPAK